VYRGWWRGVCILRGLGRTIMGGMRQKGGRVFDILFDYFLTNR